MISIHFRKRLKQLRIDKGVNQETMSLDLKMTKNYIYNIEAGYSYPSMAQFFGICEYFGIAPHEFMKFDASYTTKEEELVAVVRGFDNDKMDRLIAFARILQE